MLTPVSRQRAAVVQAEGALRDKNQVTVPKPVVDALGMHPGDRLIFEVVEGEQDAFRVRRLRHSYAGVLAGVYGSPEEVKAYLRGEREAWEK